MKIDFYILENTHSQPLYFVCQLVEKFYAEKKCMHIHTSSQIEAERLDNLLWTYKEDSFIPHQISPSETTIPIQIGFQAAANLNDILINLSTEIPSFYAQFKHLIEIVFPDASVQQLARERYKHYREQQYELNTYKIKANSNTTNTYNIKANEL